LYENCKINGPYKRKDGRSHIVVRWPNGFQTTVSYPKFLTENRIGRYFTNLETVDHLDDNFDNNDPSNIRIIERSKHCIDDAKRSKIVSFICPICDVEFSLSGRRLNNAVTNRRRKKGKAGPFCSKSCAGKYGKAIQMGEAPLPVIIIKPEYTTNKILRSLQEETLEVETAKTGKP